MSAVVKLPDGVSHGGSYAYGKFGCRCEPCRAYRAQSRRRWASEANRPVSALYAARDDRRWPLEPLQAAAKGLLREKLAMNTEDWQKAVERGLSDRQADSWAIRLGIHPAFVWPDWIDAGLIELDRVYLYGTATSEPGWRQAAMHDAAPTRQEVAA